MYNFNEQYRTVWIGGGCCFLSAKLCDVDKPGFDAVNSVEQGFLGFEAIAIAIGKAIGKAIGMSNAIVVIERTVGMGLRGGIYCG